MSRAYKVASVERPRYFSSSRNARLRLSLTNVQDQTMLPPVGLVRDLHFAIGIAYGLRRSETNQSRLPPFRNGLIPFSTIFAAVWR